MTRRLYQKGLPLPMGIAFLLAAPILNPVVIASTYAAFGLVFASIPTRSVGGIMMPSTLVRWPLLFISGTFAPLAELDSWAQALAHLSPLTYAQTVFATAWAVARRDSAP